jgi:hypothetical protein
MSLSSQDPRQIRALRAGKNQALFRSVNERIEGLVTNGDGFVEFVCECADEDCTERVSLSVAEYERVRSEPTYFVVAPGHVVHDVERVVVADDRYFVVGKEGEAARVAIVADERLEGMPAV